MLGFDKDETRKHEGIVLNTTHQSASLATADTFVALSDVRHYLTLQQYSTYVHAIADILFHSS